MAWPSPPGSGSPRSPWASRYAELGEPPAPRPAPSARPAGVRIWSVYVPNGRALDDPHMAYKLEWLDRLAAAGRAWLAEDPQAQIVIMGDWNVAPSDEDV